MIPKYSIPEIHEFMNAVIVDDSSVYSSTMKVFIPSLMLDIKPSGNSYQTIIKNDIFVSKEKIRAASQVTCCNYINAAVSPLIPHLYPESIFYAGRKVRLFIPNFDLHKAVIVPL